MTAISKKQRKITRQKDLEVGETRDLLIRAQAGSREAFRKLVLLHQQMVRVYVSKYVHCAESADDIAQEVFLAAYKQLNQFRGDAKFSTWLLGIARNKSKQFFRVELRRRKLSKDVAESKALQMRFLELNGNSDLTVEERRASALTSCLEQIPAPARVLIEEFYFNGETSKTMAIRSGQKEGTIRMKLMRIRQLLHKCIVAKTNS